MLTLKLQPPPSSHWIGIKAGFQNIIGFMRLKMHGGEFLAAPHMSLNLRSDVHSTYLVCSFIYNIYAFS